MVEGCVNSRPLAFTGDGLKSGKHMTPCYIITGRIWGSKASFGTDVPKVNSMVLAERVQYRSQVLARFWSG